MYDTRTILVLWDIKSNNNSLVSGYQKSSVVTKLQITKVILVYLSRNLTFISTVFGKIVFKIILSYIFVKSNVFKQSQC